MSEFDAIFVGAGHNSLACAAHLALKGWKTAVFERNPISGGAVQTREVTLPGFRHDLGAMNLSLFAGSAFHKKYANELKAAGLEFAPVADCFASVFPDGRWFGVSNDLEKTAARLAAFSAEDAETWRRLVGGFMGEAEHLFRLLGSPMSGALARRHRLEPLAQEGRLRRARHGQASRCRRRARGSTTISPRRMSRRRSPPGACISTSRPISPAARSSPISNPWPTRVSAWCSARAAPTRIIMALEGMLTAAGGKIFHDAEVAEITTSGGKATGIRLASGETHTATKAVIAGVAPGALPGKLLPQGSGDAGFDTAMKKFRHAPGTMMIHLALDGLPDWTRRRRAEEFRLCPRRAVARPDGEDLPAGDCRAAAGRAGAGGRPADRRSIRRVRPKASMCSGCRCAHCQPR